MIKFFDAHTHVQFKAFSDDWIEVLNRAVAAGVGLVNVGTQKTTSELAIKITEEYEKINPNSRGMIYATVGLHPIHTSKSFWDENELGAPEDNKQYSFMSKGEEFDYGFYKNLAINSRVVAIGECGLDYFRLKDNEAKQKQIKAFEAQIELAFEVKKPLMIHCRDALLDLIEILKSHKNILNDPPGIAHFFAGEIKEAKELLDLGFYFTFGGVITFSRNYDEVIKFIPNDRILSETDAPYVAPVPYRGKRNEPIYVIEVIKKLAEIKAKEFENFNRQILKNTFQVFKIKQIR